MNPYENLKALSHVLKSLSSVALNLTGQYFRFDGQSNTNHKSACRDGCVARKWNIVIPIQKPYRYTAVGQRHSILSTWLHRCKFRRPVYMKTVSTHCKDTTWLACEAPSANPSNGRWRCSPPRCFGDYIGFEVTWAAGTAALGRLSAWTSPTTISRATSLRTGPSSGEASSFSARFEGRVYAST